MKRIIKTFIKKIFFICCDHIVSYSEQYRKEKLFEKFDLDPSVKIGSVELIGNIKIGKRTYINNGSVLSSGEISKVIIGRFCAIGRNVHISAKTHSLRIPTADEINSINEHVESDVIVGDYVWIGDNVFVCEGVKIGNYAIIATNSVLRSDVNDFEIVGGTPAKHLRYNTEHFKYKKKSS